jgi:acyl-CoA synthetase (AMP-forming)/AMP-acid ligase II
MTAEPRNIPELLRQRVEAVPDKIFLFSEADKRRFTYREFVSAVGRTAAMLAAHGIQKGDVVSLLLPNSAEYIIAYFACWQLGALAGPVNGHLKEQEIAYVVANSESKLMLVNSEFLGKVERLETARVVFDDEGKTSHGFEEKNTDKVSEEEKVKKEDEAIIIYTSGTTGKPKGCLLTHGNVIANARQISQWLGFTEKDRLLTIMPLFHMNAVSVTTMSALYAGGSTVVSQKFSASRFWNIISDYQITSFGSVATMLSILLSTYPNGVPAGLKTDQLRFAMCGSAPVPAEVLRRFEKTFNCLVVEGYGLSESTCRSTFNPPDQRRRPGSCGLPIGNEMRVVD